MLEEHDASLDRRKAFSECFGEANYVFQHKGVNFIVLDDVSEPAARRGICGDGHEGTSGKLVVQ